MACDFVQNRDCEYFPCHSGIDEVDFNCLFCFCPLYALGADCGGNFRYTDEGIKDCSVCLRPHRRQSYGEVCDKSKLVMEMAKKPPEKP